MRLWQWSSTLLTPGNATSLRTCELPTLRCKPRNRWKNMSTDSYCESLMFYPQEQPTLLTDRSYSSNWPFSRCPHFPPDLSHSSHSLLSYCCPVCECGVELAVHCRTNKAFDSSMPRTVRLFVNRSTALTISTTSIWPNG